MRRSRQPDQGYVPDPSATIPDFGPRPDIDQEKLDEIRRLIPPTVEPERTPPAAQAPQAAPQREPVTPSTAPISAAAKKPEAPPAKSRTWIYAVGVVVLALLAALIGFFIAVGGTLAAYFFIG